MYFVLSNVAYFLEGILGTAALLLYWSQTRGLGTRAVPPPWKGIPGWLMIASMAIHIGGTALASGEYSWERNWTWGIIGTLVCFCVMGIKSISRKLCS